MTRYTEKQKLAAVTAYRKAAGGLRATASAHDVGVDSLRVWIAAYEANGKAGLVAKRHVIYDLDFKLEVLCRMQDEGLSCRQVAALFNIRRLDLVAEWNRLYAAHGAAALQPGWKWEQTRMSKPSSKRNDREAVTNDQRSREELLRDLQQLRAENAYLKKVQALARSKSRSAPVKGR
ncbi:transposase [Variovorax paradoxus]|uniref:transposase n=1 Tax=Variovorax paradoxus TaxID=34073 RepID=UPI00339274E3